MLNHSPTSSHLALETAQEKELPFPFHKGMNVATGQLETFIHTPAVSSDLA